MSSNTGSSSTPPPASGHHPVLPTRSPVVLPGVVSTLQVGRAASARAVETAKRDEEPLLVIPQLDPNVVSPAPSDLCDYGVLCDILQVDKTGPRSYAVTLRARGRRAIVGYSATSPYFIAETEMPSEPPGGTELEELLPRFRAALLVVLAESWGDRERARAVIEGERDPERLLELTAAHTELEREVQIAILTSETVSARLRAALPTLGRLRRILNVKTSLDAELVEDATRDAREQVLRDRMRVIKEELGESDSEVDEYRARVGQLDMPSDAREATVRQINRMSQMAQSSPEYNVARTYVETMLDLPWGTYTEDRLDVGAARELLESEHSSLEKVKKRILEFIAVRKLAPDKQGPILCLVGPPGVGKTSLGRSIANALQRKYVRVSLGGMRDESEIRGHRRTYIGALTGRIAGGLIKSGSMNPVFVLDEIDKLGSDVRGDPSSAMLEVLDPEQNHAFSDHYLEIDLDLSKVMFVATANHEETIPPPLLDRMEVIRIPGYTQQEKRTIATDHLIPKQIEEHGLAAEQFTLDEEALSEVIYRYTREAGVRNLEREIAALCRHAAVVIASEEGAAQHINRDDIATILGPPRFFSEIADRKPEVGICTGLSWTPTGGNIMFIEARSMPGSGKLKLTGQLGEVMSESATAAFSWVRANAERLAIDSERLASLDIHMHIPSGAIKKDGPSAGVAISIALVSLLKEQPVRNDVAVTGEITLRGLSLPVGGIKEKVLAAHRAGITTVLLPERNRKDLEDIPEEIREQLEIRFVKKADEVIAIAMQAGDAVGPGSPLMPSA